MKTLLDVADVAKELNVNPIAVKRLIARRRLQATRLGETDQWRITAESLADYVKRGAQDLIGPAVDELWFTDNLAFQENLFSEKLLAAARDQRLTQADVDQLAKKQPKLEFDLRLKLSPAMLTVVQGPPGLDAFNPNKEMYARFKDWRELYLAEGLRNQARTAIRKNAKWKARPSIEMLYASPEQYSEITDAAMTAVEQKQLLFKESRLALQETEAQRNIHLTYLLSQKELVGSLRSRLIDIAF